MEQDLSIFEKFVRSDWAGTVVGVVAIVFVTLVVSRIATTAIRRLLKKTTLLPASSIFVNLVRALVWIIGISCVLSICFNVNVSAIITALGVGGIAVSLGMQDTISNLIGGFQVSVARIVKPGDNIQVGTLSGIKGRVTDVTLRYTHMVNGDGDRIVIPNSMLNSNAIVHLDPICEVNVPVVVTYNEERLTWVAHHMEDAAAKAVARVSKLKKGPQVQFSSVNEHGFAGVLFFTISDPARIDDAADAAIRAIAPYVHAHPVEQMMDAMESLQVQARNAPVPQVLKAVDHELASDALLEGTGAMEPVVPTNAAEKASAAQQPAGAKNASARETGPDAGEGEDSTPAKKPHHRRLRRLFEKEQ
ncbi:mechanosensitive ion channel family protein [Parvibacter caecicola]|uniref:mechanosensitive ion channel family protein n=1 Tax=Parvibacter caecicola TaxID=747645 RepID=UPI00249AB00D|nr:mechanosensitive ion channel family protein [Parvibacter caecicola]